MLKVTVIETLFYVGTFCLFTGHVAVGFSLYAVCFGICF